MVIIKNVGPYFCLSLSLVFLFFSLLALHFLLQSEEMLVMFSREQLSKGFC